MWRWRVRCSFCGARMSFTELICKVCTLIYTTIVLLICKVCTLIYTTIVLLICKVCTLIYTTIVLLICKVCTLIYTTIVLLICKVCTLIYTTIVLLICKVCTLTYTTIVLLRTSEFCSNIQDVLDNKDKLLQYKPNGTDVNTGARQARMFSRVFRGDH